MTTPTPKLPPMPEMNLPLSFTVKQAITVGASVEEWGFACYERGLADAREAAQSIEQARTEFCWLVELFDLDGNSLGRYHTGFSDLQQRSRETADPQQAKRYRSEAIAVFAAGQLFHLEGVWRAVEHGFAAAPVEQARELSDDARDAARYRQLRDVSTTTWRSFQEAWRMPAAQCDAAVDAHYSAARSPQPTGKEGA